MTSPSPQPLTEDDLARIREASEWAISANDAVRLLAEVDRLRAQLHNERQRLNEALADNVRALGRITESEARRKDLFRRLGEHMDDLGDANAEVSRLRAENTAQAAKLAAVAELHHSQVVYLEWHEFAVQSSKRSVCSECSSTVEGRIVLWPCDTDRALGLDQPTNKEA